MATILRSGKNNLSKFCGYYGHYSPHDLLAGFHAYVRRGIVSVDWAGKPDEILEVGE